MKKINHFLIVSIVLVANLFFVKAQNHPVEWLKNSNFIVSSDGKTITHGNQSSSATLLSKHYLDSNENGYIDIYNFEDLKDFSIYFESEDKLGNLSKDYGLLFNHILETSTNDNQELDSIIALQYKKYKLTKVTSKDGTKQLKTRDFKILDHGKMVTELDDPQAAIAIPYDFSSTIRIEKVDNKLLIKKNGVILKTFNNIPKVKYRIGIHSYAFDPQQLNQLSIDTSFSLLDISNDNGDTQTTPPQISCVDVNINPNINWNSSCSRDITGKVIGTSIKYFDEFGKTTQTQTIDIKTKKIWMSQPIYDSQGRAMFNSMSAPIGLNFGYKTDFIKKEDGTVLTRADLENASTIFPVFRTL